MNEVLRAAAIEGEAPVNPYSLLAAVNSSSDTAHTAWLIFIGIMSYLLIAIAGVTHKDLLLANNIALPILQVQIDLTSFFLFAPIALVLFHLGVVSQLVMLARKALEFDSAIRVLEVTDRRTHPLRLELNNFFFVQAIAGPDRSRIMGAFLHGMTWLTLVILPVVLLIYVQVVFLPYHDVGITWAHRAALVLDMALLILIGVFLLRAESSFFLAFLRLGRAHPLRFIFTTAILAVLSAFSFGVATIPGERLDVLSRALPVFRQHNVEATSDRMSMGFVLPFIGARPDGSLFGFFERNLNATDLDLVVDKDATPGEPTLNLRGRDLRFARLDRTDLHQADLTGANLEGASLVGADLRGATLQCADLNALILSEDRSAARCAAARSANFSRARLKDARMSGLDLRGARLEDADLEGAELAYAALSGASFYNARLERADLTGGVNLQATNFATASMQGVDLTGARLHGADFTSAGLQGAVLAHALLMGATLRDADLEGADLYKAKLQGADLRGARLHAATLREASLWMTLPPDRMSTELVDLGDIAVKPLGVDDVADLNRMLQGVQDDRLLARIRDSVAFLVAPEARRVWVGAPADQQAWIGLAASSASGLDETYRTRLTNALGDLACKPRWDDGAVATGVARRALSIEFKGDVKALFDRLRSSGCPASGRMSRQALHALSVAADGAPGK